MLASEERLMGSRESWFNMPSCAGRMPRENMKQEVILESDGGSPVQEYVVCNVEVKEETVDVDDRKKEYMLLVGESAPCTLSSNNSIVPDFIKAEQSEEHKELKENVYSRREPYINETPRVDINVHNCEKFQTLRIKEICSLLCPKYLETLGPNQGHQTQVNEALHSGSVIQQIHQGTENLKVGSSNILSLRLQLNPWETERMLKRREQDRRRKARQRAQESDEQKNMRRERERLAKAAIRASEPMEKRLIRRERDRIAKATSRAAETDEQRKMRREKNRVAMAALRAAQTEEERCVRRERDRIKKAAIRAFETEEEKRIRREKNRVAMANRRANLNEHERNYLRNVNRIAKAAARSGLSAEDRALLMMEAKLERDEAIHSELDAAELSDLNDDYSNSIDCFAKIETTPNFGGQMYEESSSEGEVENSERRNPYPGPWVGGTPKILFPTPSTSNLHTSISSSSTS